LPIPARRRIVAALKATDLAYNRALGIIDAAVGAEHLLELPFAPLVQNHLGTMHAAAQFSLAEAASAECLQRHFGAAVGEVFAVVRGVEIGYRRPATGDLLAFGRPDEATRAYLLAELNTRGRAKAVILIDLKDRSGTLTFHGQFEWFISRVPPPRL
jgi:acyl-coenzyme A thioesterase PaaI-like protein